MPPHICNIFVTETIISRQKPGFYFIFWTFPSREPSLLSNIINYLSLPISQHHKPYFHWNFIVPLFFSFNLRNPLSLPFFQAQFPLKFEKPSFLFNLTKPSFPSNLTKLSFPYVFTNPLSITISQPFFPFQSYNPSFPSNFINPLPISQTLFPFQSHKPSFSSNLLIQSSVFASLK